MAELTFDIVELVLKKVSDACKKSDTCKGCQFCVAIKRNGAEWLCCRLDKEPHLWFFEEGAEK